jgi:hypothetical protein
VTSGMTAHTLDFYFGWLEAASVWALVSAGVAAICLKHKLSGLAWVWGTAFFGSALAAAYRLWKML